MISFSFPPSAFFSLGGVGECVLIFRYGGLMAFERSPSQTLEVEASSLFFYFISNE
jgi:hypothetical protein